MSDSNRFSAFKRANFSNQLMIVMALIVAIGIVYWLLQGANYLVNDVLALSGIVKFMTQFLAVILCLYPVSLVLNLLVMKLLNSKKTQSD